MEGEINYNYKLQLQFFAMVLHFPVILNVIMTSVEVTAGKYHLILLPLQKL
jgi:hypothetical protein